MKKFENCGFTSILTNDKLKIEIPISGLVSGFEGNPENCDESTIKRGKRKEFAEFVAKHIVNEADSETGNTYIGEAFDRVFELLLEGYEDGDFIKWNNEDEDED